MLCQDVFNDTLTYLVGIVVNGPDYCGFHEMPALFTNVLKHYKWIDSIIDPNFSGRKSISEKILGRCYKIDCICKSLLILDSVIFVI